MEIFKKSQGRKGQKGREHKYDISFMRKVAMEYIEGNQSLRQVGIKYNISFRNVSRWSKQFSGELAEVINPPLMTEEEKKEFEALRKQNEALQKKLEYEQMRNFALETMVDLAKTELGIDLRKNSGAKQPGE